MEYFNAIAALAALAHATRLDIFRLLIRHNPSGLPVSGIAEHVSVPPATLSFHLSHLQRSGLLKSRRESRQIIYTADYALMTTLIGFLTENCCQDGKQNTNSD